MAQRKRWTDKEFTKIWATSSSAIEVSQKLGNCTPQAVSAFASRLRKTGVKLPRYNAHGRHVGQAEPLKYDFDCPVKNAVRSQFFGNWTRKNGSGPAKFYLCLPAEQCLCIKEALHLGVIDKHTTILWAERDPIARKKINAYLKAEGFENIGGKSLSRLVKVLRQLSSLMAWPGTFVDLAFVDLCGEMTAKNKATLDSLGWLLTEDSIVGVTLQSHARHPASFKFNNTHHIKRVGTTRLDKIQKNTFQLGAYEHTPQTITPGIVGHISEALSGTGLEFEQVILYRSPQKRTNMSLTVLV